MNRYELPLNGLDTLVGDVLRKFKSGVIVLQGDLASGKTTLTKAFAEHLGLDAHDVTSPTFSLQQCYGKNFFHYDIYNHGLEHFLSLGMLEELERDGLHFVEWGDKKFLELLNSVGIDAVVIKIKKKNNDIRQYEVEYAHA